MQEAFIRMSIMASLKLYSKIVPVVLTSRYLFFVLYVYDVLQNWFFFVKFDLHLFIVPLAHARVPYIL